MQMVVLNNYGNFCMTFVILFYLQMDEEIKTRTLRFPAKENPKIMEN